MRATCRLRVSEMPEATASADISMTDDHDHPDGAHEEEWANYQRQMGTIFQEIVNGTPESASETPSSATADCCPRWLTLVRVVATSKTRLGRRRQRKDDKANQSCPGLNLDETNLHADRIKLWDDFNHAWLGLYQKQIEMVSPQQLSRPQSPMPKAMIKKIGNELIRLCDEIERHRLVDYQLGI